MERRSATHDASIVVEASTDGGASFLPVADDTLRPTGGTSFVERLIRLPDWIQGQPAALVRWRVTGDGTGATGTIRLDDISVAGRPRRDLSLSAGWTSPSHPLAGDEVRCGGPVVNTGYEAAADARVEWALDLDGNGVPDLSEFQGSIEPGALLPGDSGAYEFGFTRPGPGPLAVFAIVRSDSDMVAANDTVRFQLSAAVAPRAVVVNEIMYDPLPGRAEYVELFNRSGDTINLRGWRLIDDEDDTTGGRLGAGDIILGPGGYLLCSPDTTMPVDYPGIPGEARIIEGMRDLSLNNTGDLLLLVDATGATIDRVGYDPQWHTPALGITQGRSLERIESSAVGSGTWNWGTSAGSSGGTPGYRNSLTPERAVRDDRLSCFPNPFSPDGDGLDDVTLIGYRLDGGPVIARVRIYNQEGRPVRMLTGSEYVTGMGSFVWNGHDDRGRKAPIGMYVILLDAVDASGTEAFSAKGVVVVAGRL
ncbi:MAG TPA: lamin tail domain-containing protein [Bacteroidota bacterium]|nr:lamin tail domain-containing protein [Bacteroidota bacterium]